MARLLKGRRAGWGPITNAGFDSVRMLRKAQDGAYPSAALRSKDRAVEIAYWQARVAAVLPSDAGDTPVGPGAGED